MIARINRESILSPISETEPCGKNLLDLSEYYLLEDLVKGKEETQFSDPEPPDWGKALEVSKTLLEQGKELWVIVYLIHALVALEGFQGLSEGLDLLYEILTRYWFDIYPGIDDDDENPVWERMNILSNLSTPGCPFLEHIKEIPVCDSRQIGTFSYRDIMVARGDIPKRDHDKEADIPLIEAAVQDTDIDGFNRVEQALSQSRYLISNIHKFLTEMAGEVNNTLDFSPLSHVLSSLHTFITAHPPAAGESEPAETETDAGDESCQTPEISDDRNTIGNISHRNDIITLFDNICAWYFEHEPSSPVPLFIERARDLVGKNFRDIVSDIASKADNQLTTFFGAPGKHMSADSRECGNNPSRNRKETVNPNTAAFKIRNQNDVLKAFDRINSWYDRHESSSPVPIFVTRAKNLVGKNFQDIINDIASQAADQIKILINE